MHSAAQVVKVAPTDVGRALQAAAESLTVSVLTVSVDCRVQLLSGTLAQSLEPTGRLLANINQLRQPFWPKYFYFLLTFPFHIQACRKKLNLS